MTKLGNQLKILIFLSIVEKNVSTFLAASTGIETATATHDSTLKTINAPVVKKRVVCAN